MRSTYTLAAALALMSLAAGVVETEARPGEKADAIALPNPYRVVDLTHVLDKSFPYIPIEGITFPFQLVPIATIEKDHVAANAWKIHEHLGTQIDAPNHFAKDGRALHELRTDELLVSAVVIDFREQARANVDAALSVEDILAWEKRYRRIPDGCCVIVYTGWDTRIATRSRSLDSMTST